MPTLRSVTRLLAIASCCLVTASRGWCQASPDALTQGFENPPSSARPRVWWHWMNGNISQEGIKLDLEWMHRVGIAGYQNFDAALNTPQVVEKRLAYMTPEWKEAFKYAVQLGDKLDMEVAIAGSPGWSETGGPWVPPGHGMKKYVWSETIAEGGKPFSRKLPHPPTQTGAFQNLGMREDLRRPPIASPPEFYADAAVVAFRIPRGEEQVHPEPKISSSGDGLNAAMLSDGDLEKTTKVPIPREGAESWIQFEYPSPETIQAVTYVTKDPNIIVQLIAHMGVPEKTLEASDDGQNFRTVVRLSGGRAPEHTLCFAPVTARYFRVTFRRTPPPPLPAWAEGNDPASFGVPIAAPPQYLEVAELVLYSAPRINHFEEKAAFVPEPELYQYVTPDVD
ncbi:MAG: glycoside hydrolase, partial [Acidobacteria bacterium]|nr:glycoside hydrolase [Acidobacteriota bacterium]